MNHSLREGINIWGKLALRGCTPTLPPFPLMETVPDILMRRLSQTIILVDLLKESHVFFLSNSDSLKYSLVVQQIFQRIYLVS